MALVPRSLALPLRSFMRRGGEVGACASEAFGVGALTEILKSDIV